MLLLKRISRTGFPVAHRFKTPTECRIRMLLYKHITREADIGLSRTSLQMSRSEENRVPTMTGDALNISDVILKSVPRRGGSTGKSLRYVDDECEASSSLSECESEEEATSSSPKTPKRAKHIVKKRKAGTQTLKRFKVVSGLKAPGKGVAQTWSSSVGLQDKVQISGHSRSAFHRNTSAIQEESKSSRVSSQLQGLPNRALSSIGEIPEQEKPQESLQPTPPSPSMSRSSAIDGGMDISASQLSWTLGCPCIACKHAKLRMAYNLLYLAYPGTPLG